ncbi:COMM domain-containing protein 4 [Schistocerca nitens]|uniref:COMM domain-containing protein 4 n=1 Tax=Schistocerca nitens TaxID=7011 RepID=UPI002118A21B|nr:COMM domain-containing protein 4 [Schistocerca nitens]XP_049789862.1 COMM domain-containing protein 4 [Schistocerca nitens]XP_049789870.1 COMM domain-containing protein 4 [Schistocerca nitens]XP_049789875.1 COMM domain-containing protein 4 [Schistocerca nitens]
MRFRFCGDLDCPDWILAEINTLARMTSIKMKLLCQQVARSLIGEDIDYDKVKKLTADAKYVTGDVKGCVAAVSFVLTSGARHGVTEEALSSELQQLGLPRELSAALCRVYSDNLPAITAALRDNSLRLSHLKDVSWRVDLVGGSNVLSVDGEIRPEVCLKLQVLDCLTGEEKYHQFNVTEAQLNIMIDDLKKVTGIIDSL